MGTELDIPIAERLAKLVRVLSSDKEGEVVAAATAITRVLKENGHDIHTLADLITNRRNEASPEAIQRAYRTGFKDGLRHDEGNDGDDADDRHVTAWRDMAKFCVARSDRLKTYERDFVTQMLRWTALGREPSAKQARWLDYIYTRLIKEERKGNGRRRQR